MRRACTIIVSSLLVLGVAGTAQAQDAGSETSEAAAPSETVAVAEAQPAAEMPPDSMRFVTARDPQGLLQVLKDAGYDPELDTDPTGDPKIYVELNGWNSQIYFYGCDENTHDGCDAIQLSASFVRKKPMKLAKALKISERYRYLSVFLDNEGDPYLQWDIVTLDALPQAVFLASLRRYGEVLDGAAELIFEDE